MYQRTSYHRFIVPKLTLSADGSSTQETLLTEKRRLETRLNEIPQLISSLERAVKIQEADVEWLKALGYLKRRKWEKDNGKTIETALSNLDSSIASKNGQIQTLNTEKAKLPEQIEVVNRQLQALIKGESDGLSKGLTKDQAQQMGALALQKEQTAIQEEIKLKETQPTTEDKKMNPTLKWGIVIVVCIGAIWVLIQVVKQSRKAQLLNERAL